MNSRIHILEELRELNSSLPATAKEPVFTVPDGYFDQFAASVLAKIKGAEAESVTEELNSLSPLLAAIPKHMPYTTPENYFADLATDLPAMMDEEVLPSVLSEHHRLMPYETPAGYFDTLPQQVLAKVTQPQAKVIPMFRRKWMRMAAAAMVIGILALGGIFYATQNTNTVDPGNNPEEWVAKKLNGVSNDALEEFIQTTDVDVNSNAVAHEPTKHTEVRSLLGDVSNHELENFLKEIPTDEELAIN